MKKTLSEQQVERDISALRENTEQIKKLAQEVSSSDTDKMEWEERFDEMFNEEIDDPSNPGTLISMRNDPEGIKDFIRTELQKAADRERVKVVEEIEKLESNSQKKCPVYLAYRALGHDIYAGCDCGVKRDFLNDILSLSSLTDTNTKKK